MKRAVVLFSLSLLFFIPFLHAQCIDSTYIQYGAYCDNHFDPVCGCDGKTYLNDCFSRNAGLTGWQYTTCDPVYFVFNPNPATDIIYVDALLQYQGDMYVELIDRFGRVFYSTIFPDVQRYSFEIPAKGYPAGLYYIHIYCAQGSKVEKVVIPGNV